MYIEGLKSEYTACVRLFSALLYYYYGNRSSLLLLVDIMYIPILIDMETDLLSFFFTPNPILVQAELTLFSIVR